MYYQNCNSTFFFFEWENIIAFIASYDLLFDIIMRY